MMIQLKIEVNRHTIGMDPYSAIKVLKETFAADSLKIKIKNSTFTPRENH